MSKHHHNHNHDHKQSSLVNSEETVFVNTNPQDTTHQSTVDDAIDKGASFIGKVSDVVKGASNAAKDTAENVYDKIKDKINNATSDSENSPIELQGTVKLSIFDRLLLATSIAGAVAASIIMINNNK